MARLALSAIGTALELRGIIVDRMSIHEQRRHEIILLVVWYGHDGIRKQVYLNSGMWRRVHDHARCETAEEEFVDYYVLTYLAFFKGDERGGRKFESWSSALGPLQMR